MLKQSSIQKMKNSQYLSRIRASNNHLKKQKERQLQKYEVTRWYRNQGAVVTGEGESPHHKFIKFCCALYFEENGYDYISEYRLKGFECDIFIPSLNYFIELETNLTKTKKDSKLKQFRHIIDSGNCEFFIFEIKNLSKNYEEVLDYFQEKFGL